MDQRAESAIGRMFLTGAISEAQFWASDRWKSIVAQFHVVLATPMTTGSTMGLMVAPGVGQEEESGKAERRETDIEMRDRVLDQHKAAMQAIRALDASALVFAVLETVVLRDQPCGAQMIFHLRKGLDALGNLWGLSNDADYRPVRSKRYDRAAWDHEEKEVMIIYRAD